MLHKAETWQMPNHQLHSQVTEWILGRFSLIESHEIENWAEFTLVQRAIVRLGRCCGNALGVIVC